jgi:hypothetical protein
MKYELTPPVTPPKSALRMCFCVTNDGYQTRVQGWIFLSILIALFSNAAMAAPPTAINFSVGQPSDYFTDDTAGRVEITAVGDTQRMVVSDATVRVHDFKVTPSTKYTMNLKAAFEGDVESMEENPRFEIFNQMGKTSPRLPSREIRFFDDAGKPVGLPMQFAMPFKNQRTYQDAFYTPSDAVTAQISLTSGKDIRLVLLQLNFEKSSEDTTLNVNPSFQLGPDNYSGWQNISSGGQLIQRDGTTILDTKYGSTGQMIPLPEPGTYAFSAKATPNGYNSVVIVRVYDASGKELMRSSTRRYGPRTYFVPPKEAVSASFLVYSCLLEEIRLVRIGDEEEINSIPDK